LVNTFLLFVQSKLLLWYSRLWFLINNYFNRSYTSYTSGILAADNLNHTSDEDMPRCEGRPNGPCPSKAGGVSVTLCQGDLMLCKECELFRFPYLKEVKATSAKVVKVSTSAAVSASASEDMSSSPVEVDVSGSLTDGNDISPTTVEKSDKLLICELLFFAINSFDKHPSEVIKTAISEFYREDEILAAKNTLAQVIPQDIKGSPTEKYVTRRIGLHKVKNSVEDIFNLLDVIDSNGLREQLPTFCAANMARIPTLPDEMSDLTSIRYELNVLRKQVELLTSYLKPPPVWKVQSNSDEGEQRRVNMDKDFPPLQSQDYNQAETSNEPFRKSLVLPQPQPTVEAASGNPPNSRDDAGWEEPKKKGRPKNKKLVIGHSESHTSFVGIAKKSVVCVSRLKSGTPTDVVSDHLKNNGINVLSCFDVSPSVENELKYTSMRVCVYTMDVNKLYDGNLWPLGVVVRPWKFKSKS